MKPNECLAERRSSNGVGHNALNGRQLLAGRALLGRRHASSGRRQRQCKDESGRAHVFQCY